LLVINTFYGYRVCINRERVSLVFTSQPYTNGVSVAPMLQGCVRLSVVCDVCIVTKRCVLEQTLY